MTEQSSGLEPIASTYTLHIDQPLPKFSRLSEKMGCTHLAWLNSYLERRAQYIEETSNQGLKPILADFHARLAVNTPEAPISYVALLAKVAATIKAIAEPTVERTAYSGLYTTYPICVTARGAAAIEQQFKLNSDPKVGGRQEPTEPPVIDAGVEITQANGYETLVGRFVINNGFVIVNPADNTVIDPNFLRALIPLQES